MSLQFDIRTNAAAIQDKIKGKLGKTTAFATAQTLTAIVRAIKADEVKNEHGRLDRPRPFTTQAVGTEGARSDKLVAKVGMKDITAKYLDPYQFGGLNVLNSRALISPVKGVTPLDQYGNIPAGWMQKNSARSDVFYGPVTFKNGKTINGQWQRQTPVVAGEPAKVRVLRWRKKKGGGQEEYWGLTSKGAQTTQVLKLLVRFADAHAIASKNHIDWFKVAELTFDREAMAQFDKFMAAALAKIR